MSMIVSPTAREAPPEITLRQVATEIDAVTGALSIAWVITNTGPERLEILSVRLPHGQFKSDVQRFEPALDLRPRQSAQFQTTVRCDEPAGLVTENAFVIFSVICSEEDWRIFVRIRVVMNPERKPETATELITTQKVGFSGIPS